MLYSRNNSKNTIASILKKIETKIHTCVHKRVSTHVVEQFCKASLARASLVTNTISTKSKQFLVTMADEIQLEPPNMEQVVSAKSISNLEKSQTSHNPWRLLWGEIGELEGSRDVYERLISVWDTVLALGGLIAGFSYVVLSSDLPFDKEGLIGSELRPYFYGVFSVMTFIISLGSALLTVILENTLKMAGPDCAGWFALKYEQLVGMPEALVGTSIGSMLFAGLIAVKCHKKRLISI